MEVLFSKDLKDTLRRRHAVSDMDRLEALQSSTTSAPCKLREKKILFQNLLANRDPILQSATVLDLAYNTDLHAALSRDLPSNHNITRQDNVALSLKLLNFFDPIEVFHTHMKEQDEAANRPATHSGENGSPSYLPIELSGRVVAIKEKVDLFVVNKNATSIHSLFNSVKLSSLQKAYHFDQALHDKLDDAQKQCPFCLHYSLIWVPENDTVADENTVAIRDYDASMKVWNAYIASCDTNKGRGHAEPARPKHPKTGAIMKRSPTAPKLRSVIVMCTCRNSHCLCPGNDIGSSCFINCIDCKTGKHFESKGPSRRCSCDVCGCICPAAWQIQDHMKIGLQLAQLHKNRTLFQGDKVSPEQGLRMFLRKTASAGLLAVEGAMAIKKMTWSTNRIATSLQLSWSTMERLKLWLGTMAYYPATVVR